MENNATPLRSGNNKPRRVNPDEKNKTDFDSENDEAEINPEKLEREEMNPDSAGNDNSKPHQPYEFKKNNSEKKSERENLLGQGGYGTSGTSGTNSGGKQGYQSGLGPAGSQNGSAGYNAGSLGYKPKVKEVDINKLGKDAH